ncbi:MAG: DinB family protein [Planctomycetia bacterium]|nr:DinB family protein [Planctomycetia bacterium]
MTDPLLHAWNLNVGYAKRLVADIPDDKMTLQPAPDMNHAAWVLGHLACTADMLGAMIGVKPVCPHGRSREHAPRTTLGLAAGSGHGAGLKYAC